MTFHNLAISGWFDPSKSRWITIKPPFIVVKSQFSFGFPMVYHYFPMNHQKKPPWNHHPWTATGLRPTSFPAALGAARSSRRRKVVPICFAIFPRSCWWSWKIIVKTCKSQIKTAILELDSWKHIYIYPYLYIHIYIYPYIYIYVWK